MATRKTTLVIPTDLKDFTIPVIIEGYIEKSVTAHRYCTNGHDPERVRQTTTCPSCGNADWRSFQQGVESGGAVALISPADEDGVVTVEKKDHSKAVITAHPRDTFSEQTLVQGTVYRVAPQPGNETAFLSLMCAIEQHPDRAYVTTWGWTDKVTKIWLLGVYLGNLVFMEAQHPSNVRQLAAPTGNPSKVMTQALGELIDEVDFVVDDYEDHQAAAKAALASLGKSTAAKIEVASDPEAELLAALAAKKAKAKAKAKKVA